MTKDQGAGNGTTNKVPFPGIPTTTDGAGAVTWVETQISEGACAFPITPSTTMGGGFEAAVSNGAKNLFGEELSFMELESEHSSASTCEGFAVAGGRVTNFTSGQGLVLMKEVLYTISGKRLPIVFHIGARAMTSHSLNVHAGHDDVMAVADTGWGVLFARTAQEAGDFALIARRAAENSHTPIMSVQDGFLTTHTIENVLLPEREFMKNYVGDPRAKLVNMMDPSNPVMSGVVQNQDSYMKGKVAQRTYCDTVRPALDEAFEVFAQATGRRYDVLATFDMADAEFAFVGIGSFMETARVTAKWLREARGMKVGVVGITSFQPFPGKELVEALAGVEAFAIMERMDDGMAPDNPVTVRVKAAFADAILGQSGIAKIDRIPRILSGVGGLGSRDVRPGDWIGIAEALQAGRTDFYSIGIKHATAITGTEDPDLRPESGFSMRGHSVGGYGSVTTNKVIATLAAEIFDLQVQAYPKYGSEKKGLPTTYYLTVAEEPILTHAELLHVEFIPMNDVNAFNLGNPLAGLSPGGSIFIQSKESEPAAVWPGIPKWARDKLRELGAKVYFMDTVSIAREMASTSDLAQRMQGIVLLGIFLKITPFLSRREIDDDELFAAVEGSLQKFFGKRGEQVVQDNLKCVRAGFLGVQQIPAECMRAGALSKEPQLEQGAGQ